MASIAAFDVWQRGNGTKMGTVLQVVQAVKTDAFVSALSSYTDVPGLSVNITPSSTTSKILVCVNTNLGCDAFLTYMRLVRNSTYICLGDAAGSRPTVTAASAGYTGTNTVYNATPVSFMYLDSPATTSATTYKLQVNSYSSGYYATVNRTYSDRDTSAYEPRMMSTLIAMEIQA